MVKDTLKGALWNIVQKMLRCGILSKETALFDVDNTTILLKEKKDYHLHLVLM